MLLSIVSTHTRGARAAGQATKLSALIVAGFALSGCGGGLPVTSDTPQVTQAAGASPTADSAMTPTPVVVTSPPQAPPAPTLSHSATWSLSNELGYTYDLTLSLGEPTSRGQSGVSHPKAASNRLGSICGFDGNSDAAIPAEIAVTATTPGEATTPGAALIIASDYAIGRFGPPDPSEPPLAAYNGVGITPYADDDRVSVEQFYSDGGHCWAFSSTNSWGYGQAGGFAYGWSSPVATGDIVKGQFFIIVHNYYTPAMPQGDPDLLGYIALRPMLFGQVGSPEAYTQKVDDLPLTLGTPGLTLLGEQVQ